MSAPVSQMSAVALPAGTEQLALVAAFLQRSDDARASRLGMPSVLFEHKSAPRDADPAFTALAVLGAVAGGVVADLTRLNLGILFSAGGAALLLWLYRSRERAAQLTAQAPVAGPTTTAEIPLGVQVLDACGWGVLCGVVTVSGTVVVAILTLFLDTELYSPFAHEVEFVFFGGGVGFVLAGAGRLARPRWTTAQMFVLVGLVAIGCGATTLGCDLQHARQTRARMSGYTPPSK